jgi:hypothetical protein
MTQRARLGRAPRRQPAGSGAPASRSRGAPAVDAILQLQGLAGNRAVVELLQRRPARARGRAGSGCVGATVPVIGPAPAPIPAGSPLPAPDAPGRIPPLGVTNPGPSSPPQFHVPGNRVAGGYAAHVQPVSAGNVQIDAQYAGPNVVYEIPPGQSGRPRRALVDDCVSALVRAGEQEHSNDFHLAYHAVYDRVAAAINALASQPAKQGRDVRDAHQQWRVALRDTLPAPLRAPVADISPNGPWTAVLARLNQLSNERDSNHWHDMGWRPATRAERRQYAVPDGTDLITVVPGGQIGRHPSQARIDAAVPGLSTP